MGGLLGVVGRKLLEVVLPTLATVVAGMIVKLLQQQLAKKQIELTTAQQQQVEQIVVDAIATVEERSRREKMTGPQKATAATTLILEQAPGLPAAEVTNLIDATLAKTRGLVPIG